jgi:hypothetical protein
VCGGELHHGAGGGGDGDGSEGQGDGRDPDGAQEQAGEDDRDPEGETAGGRLDRDRSAGLRTAVMLIVLLRVSVAAPGPTRGRAVGGAAALAAAAGYTESCRGRDRVSVEE